MRKLIAAVLVAGATLIAGQAIAADFPEYPPIIEIPEVDYGVQGSFYLRGSAAFNSLWTREGNGYDCGVCGGPTETTYPFEELGYGYSVGAGFGYETGTGLRADVTIDYASNDGLELSSPAGIGNYSAKLRSTIALANVYYDFSLGGQHGYGAAGGAFGYVGAGAGAAFNEIEVSSPVGPDAPTGTNTSFAAAAMAGVGYDFGSVVADVGYRGVYIAEVSNGAAAPATVSADNNWLHEVRGTVRYRFN
jgi:hypothetical protein